MYEWIKALHVIAVRLPLLAAFFFSRNDNLVDDPLTPDRASE